MLIVGILQGTTPNKLRPHFTTGHILLYDKEDLYVTPISDHLLYNLNIRKYKINHNTAYRHMESEEQTNLQGLNGRCNIIVFCIINQRSLSGSFINFSVIQNPFCVLLCKGVKLAI